MFIAGLLAEDWNVSIFIAGFLAASENRYTRASFLAASEFSRRRRYARYTHSDNSSDFSSDKSRDLSLEKSLELSLVYNGYNVGALNLDAMLCGAV